MRVRCLAETPNEDQVRQLAARYRVGKTVYPVVFGQEYMVLGLGVWDGVTWIEIELSTEVVVSVPLFLFEIVDARPSRLWQVRVHDDGALTLWPPAFYEQTFHDRLSDGSQKAVRDFRRLKRGIEEEDREVAT